MTRNIFFAPNRKSAINYLKKVAKHEDVKPDISSLKLSKKQIPHIDGWKTWTFKWKK